MFKVILRSFGTLVSNGLNSKRAGHRAAKWIEIFDPRVVLICISNTLFLLVCLMSFWGPSVHMSQNGM